MNVVYCLIFWIDSCSPTSISLVRELVFGENNAVIKLWTVLMSLSTFPFNVSVHSRNGLGTGRETPAALRFVGLTVVVRSSFVSR